MAQRNIRMANVALIIIDASEGIMNMDAHIAGYAHEAGRAIIIVVNKWDIAPNKKKADFEQKLRDELKFLEFAQIAFISAKNNLGITQLYDMIELAYKWSNHRVTTGELNRFCAMVELKPDQVCDAGIAAAANVCGVYGSARNALFGGTAARKSVPETLRVHWDADCN